MFANHHAAGLERLLEDIQGLAGFSIAAHEHVERGIALFRPGVDRDMAFGQHRDAGNAAAVFELVQVDMKQGRARRRHRVNQGGFDALTVVQALGFPQINDHMAAGIDQAVAVDEMILVVVIRRSHHDRTRRLGSARLDFFLRDFIRRHQIQSSHRAPTRLGVDT